uniref:LIM zinc-binding domain-containing protein n=1 Tax=Denticeps clupeoides TaxID=299321 RepID=A0AAY4B773_9TELE
MESLIVDRKNFHKTCFSCEHCQSKLSLGNYVSLDGHLYCVPHYNQLLKSKGHLDENGNGWMDEWMDGGESTRVDGPRSEEGLWVRRSVGEGEGSNVEDKKGFSIVSRQFSHDTTEGHHLKYSITFVGFKITYEFGHMLPNVQVKEK